MSGHYVSCSPPSSTAVFLRYTIVIRSSRLAMWSSTLFFRAGLALLSLILTLHSATAQDTWSIDSNCNARGNNGGRFTDSLGAVWEVRCARILVNQLTRTKELPAREYTHVSRPVTTSRSVQDLYTEALVIPTQPIGFPVSGLRVQVWQGLG